MAKRGRPRKYKNAADMQKAVEKYFEEAKLEQRPPTVCGLALHLGFVQRKSFLDYEGYDDEPEFCNIIKKAKTKIEQTHEEQLSGNQKPTGHIFWLKNYGWKDERDYNLTGDVNIILKRKNGSKNKRN